MDVKDSRSEASVGDRNDGNTKFAQGGGSALPCHRNKTYQDIGSNSLGKVDAATTRPCAVIGPDRVVPPPASTEPYQRKGPPAEPWLSAEPAYRRPPEYPHKLLDYQHPTRNISPRQTFQENMQRIMVPPTYNSVKLKEDHKFPGDPNISHMRNNKLDVPTEPNSKYCDVPYNVNPILNEQKAVRNPDLSVSNMNSVLTVGAHHGWPPSANVRPSKHYPQELYQYLEYPSCAGPRPMVTQRPHRPVHEEPGPVYPEAYYHDGNIRYKPYPSVKERYPQSRYEYINNYTNSFHPSPPFTTHKYDVQKPMPPHPHPAYSQVPIKYLDGRMIDPVINSYQRSLNPQANYNNMAYRNQMIHPSYGSVPSNCVQSNQFYPYPPDVAKSMPSNKLPYADPNSKIYTAEYENRLKTLPSSESYYVNDITRMHHMKAPGLPPGYPPALHGMSTHPYYRKGYEYNPHFRNLDPMLNINGNLLTRFPTHFSPGSIAISPSDSNLSSNDPNLTHGPSHEDFGYMSQSSNTNVRSNDSAINRMSHEYQRYDHRFSSIVKPTLWSSKNEHISNTKDKKEIDVRQFLQMWNEGEEEGVENAKEVVIKTVPNSANENTNVNHFETNSQEQLYVLGLVNVPSEELAKYEHIQKVSKLPENIKGYNNIELLHQFEQIVESSNLSNYTAKLPMTKDFHSPLQRATPMHGISIPARPLSPLDVEAKISQSVIHKDVGCNFEIKPCSPKMMNVEIAAPVQSVIDERIIEKVSNPLLVPSPTTHSGNESRDHCNVITCSDSISTASCKMISSPYSRNDTMDHSNTNYSIQDLECNSGVCLASLPRLDNDIELNFPEVNQQFINANKVETVITSTSIKDVPQLEVEQCEVSECKLGPDMNNIASSNLTDKDFCKLSKYRRLKRKSSDTIASETSVQAQRTDSVIIKNPENLKRDKDVENYQNVENSPDKSLSPITTFNEAQDDPINLSVSTDYRESSPVLSECTEQLLVPNEQIEQGNDDNDINACESRSSSLLENEHSEYQENNLLEKEKQLDVKSKPLGENESIQSILEDQNNSTSKLFDEIELNKTVQSVYKDSVDNSKKRKKRRFANAKSRYDKISRVAFEGSASQPMEGEHTRQPQVSEFSAPDIEDSINVKMRELFGELSGAETEPRSIGPHKDNSVAINSDDDGLTTKMYALHEGLSMTQSDQSKKIRKMEHEKINQSQIPKEDCNTAKIHSTQKSNHDKPKVEYNMSISNKDLQSSNEKLINNQTSLMSPNCVMEVDKNSCAMLSSNSSLHISKELLSPWMQKLIVHIEGFCTNSVEHLLINDLHSNSSESLIDNVCAKTTETTELKQHELEFNNEFQDENKDLTDKNHTRVKAQDAKQKIDLNSVLPVDKHSNQTTCDKAVNNLVKERVLKNIAFDATTNATEEQDLLKPVKNSVPQEMENENYIIKSGDMVYKQLISACPISPKSESFISLQANYTSCNESRCQSMSFYGKTMNFGDGSDTDIKLSLPDGQEITDLDYSQKDVESNLVTSLDLRDKSIKTEKCENIDEPAKRPENIIPDNFSDKSMNENLITDVTAAEDYSSNKVSTCLSENKPIQINTNGGCEDFNDAVPTGTSYKENTCLAGDEPEQLQTNSEGCNMGAGTENTSSFQMKPVATNSERYSEDSADTVTKKNIGLSEPTQTNTEGVCEDFTDTTEPLQIKSKGCYKEFIYANNALLLKNEPGHTTLRCFENSTDIAAKTITTLSKNEPTQINTEDGCNIFSDVDTAAASFKEYNCLSNDEPQRTNTQGCFKDYTAGKGFSFNNQPVHTDTENCVENFTNTVAQENTYLSDNEPFASPKNEPVQTKTEGYLEDLTNTIDRSSSLRENICFTESNTLHYNERCVDALVSTVGSSLVLKENTCLSENEPFRHENFTSAADGSSPLIGNAVISVNESVQSYSENYSHDSTETTSGDSPFTTANTCLSENEPGQSFIDTTVRGPSTATGNTSSSENELVQAYTEGSREGSTEVTETVATENISVSENEPVQTYIQGCSKDSTETTDDGSSAAGNTSSSNERVQLYDSTDDSAGGFPTSAENTSLSKTEPVTSYIEGCSDYFTESTARGFSSTTGNTSLSEYEPVQSYIDEHIKDLTDVTKGGSTTKEHCCLSENEPYVEDCCEDSTKTSSEVSPTSTDNTSLSENDPIQPYIEGCSKDSFETTAGASSTENTSSSGNEPVKYEGRIEDSTDVSADGSTTKGNCCLSEDEPYVEERCEDSIETSSEVSPTSTENTSLSENDLIQPYIEGCSKNSSETTAGGTSTATGNTSSSGNEPVQPHVEGCSDNSTDTIAMGSSITTGNISVPENEPVKSYTEGHSKDSTEVTAGGSIAERNCCLSESEILQSNVSVCCERYENDMKTITDPDTLNSRNTNITMEGNHIEEDISLEVTDSETQDSTFHLENSGILNNEPNKIVMKLSSNTNEIMEPNNALNDEKCSPNRVVIMNNDILSSDNNQDYSVGTFNETFQDSGIIDDENDESDFKPVQQEDTCQGITSFNNPICEYQIENIPENSPYKQNVVFSKRKNLKRSLSETALDEIREDDEAVSHSFIRPSKRSNIIKREHETRLFAENICQVIQNHRRNSISSVHNEENVSFCILIDNDCIITDQLNESEKICFSEVTEDFIACIQEEPVNDEITTGEIMTFQEEADCCEYPADFGGNFDEEQKSPEPWLEDVACVETVVSDDIAENIDSEDEFYDGRKESCVNEHINKQIGIYGDKIHCDYDRVEYQTPQKNFDYALNASESHVVKSYSGNYDTKYSQDILLGSAIQEEASKNSIDFECTSPMSMSSNGTPENSPTRENIELDNYISNTESVSILKSKIENFGIPLTEIWNEKDETKVLENSLKINPLTCESSIDTKSSDTCSFKKSEDSKCAISSSPEVSSTTSEEKNTGILLKITNYSGSRVSQVTDNSPVNSISCKYTEKRDYLSSNGKQYLNPNLSTRTLITKAAQKYIPPLKETIPNLKVKLPLPPNSLMKLKKIKMAKATLKFSEDKSVPLKAFRQEVPKKPKPKFEDVLKSIDEIQYQKHKEKSKKVRKSIPKVVIKKSENGSHYASTSCKDSRSPDLTGRKWQPWVFLERNHFIDKMALKRKTRAIFSHRKNCYVLAEKFYKYKSVSSSKFIITQPKLDETSSGHLKYTIRLKHQY